MTRSGIQDWWFCHNRQCQEESRVPHFGGTLWTRLFLERWQRDWLKEREMRRALTIAGRPGNLDRLSPSEVVEQVAQLMDLGFIHVHASTPWTYYEEGEDEASDSKPGAPPPFPLAARSASSPASSTSEQDDPAVFNSRVDAAAQVAALKSAAEQGAPFCPQ